MDEKEAWKQFEATGSVEAYLQYTACKEREAGHDAQSQGRASSNRSNDS